MDIPCRFIIVLLSCYTICHSAYDPNLDPYAFITDRCFVRSANTDDYDNIHELLLEPEVGSYIWGVNLSPEEVKQTDSFTRKTKLWFKLLINNKTQNSKIWVVQDKTNGNFLGAIQAEIIEIIDYSNVELDPKYKYLRVACCVASKNQKKGYAKEVSRIFIDKLMSEQWFECDFLLFRLNPENQMALHLTPYLGLGAEDKGEVFLPNGLYSFASKPCTLKIITLDVRPFKPKEQKRRETI